MSGSQGYPPPAQSAAARRQPPPPGWRRLPAAARRSAGRRRPATPRPRPPPPPQWAPGMLGAAHKPGAMPLRPLGLGDIYDAAFRIIRFNPKATVGVGRAGRRRRDGDPGAGDRRARRVTVDLSARRRPATRTADELIGIVAVGSARSGSARVLQYVGMIFVTGMIAHVDRRGRDRAPALARRGVGGHPRLPLAAGRRSPCWSG